MTGYLQLAERLAGSDGARYAQAWNFGPDGRNDATVTVVAHLLAGMWGPGAAVVHASSESNPHEADTLRLDSSRACRDLGWHPRWSLHEGLERTIAWYRAWDRREDMADVSARQIAEYFSAAQL